MPVGRRQTVRGSDAAGVAGARARARPLLRRARSAPGRPDTGGGPDNLGLIDTPVTVPVRVRRGYDGLFQLLRLRRHSPTEPPASAPPSRSILFTGTWISTSTITWGSLLNSSTTGSSGQSIPFAGLIPGWYQLGGLRPRSQQRRSRLRPDHRSAGLRPGRCLRRRTPQRLPCGTEPTWASWQHGADPGRNVPQSDSGFDQYHVRNRPR